MKVTSKLQSKQSIAKGVILATLVAAVSIASQTAFSNSFLLMKSSGCDGVYCGTYITPGNKSIDVKVSLLVGVSKNSPCSDLKIIKVASDKIESASGDMRSDDIIATEGMFGYAPGSWTCLRSDVVYNDKTYSTGNIQLLWNGTQYIPSSPPYSFIMDFTK